MSVAKGNWDTSVNTTFNISLHIIPLHIIPQTTNEPQATVSHDVMIIRSSTVGS